MSESPMWNPVGGGAVIFDWDGVLADTHLDFSPIRRKYFGGRTVPILEEMMCLDREVQRSITDEVRWIELAGAAKAAPVEGAFELVDLLNERQIPWSVVSRNSPDSINLAARTIGFDLPKNTFHRESGPVKPSPEALWMAADAMGVPRRNCTVVGDFVYDLLGARRAGMRAVLVERMVSSWSHWADKAFPKMTDFLEKARENAVFVPWEYHDVADRLGLDWLMSAWKVSVELPSPLTSADMELAFKLASLGVGRFKASEDPQYLDDWRSLVWLGPEFLDITQATIAEKLMAPRYPMVEVVEIGEALPLDRFRDDPEGTLRELAL